RRRQPRPRPVGRQLPRRRRLHPLRRPRRRRRPLPQHRPPPPPRGRRGPPPTGQQLAAAISNYSSLVPRNLDQAWPLMTADYQTRHAGGRAAYERFWGGFSAVTATQVAGSSPSTATALLTYTRLDGSVIRERTTFGLVHEGGVLKIASSTVMSSSG